MHHVRTLATATLLFAAAAPARLAAQTGKQPSQPYVESSAGRALQRLTYGAFEGAGDPFSSVFANGSYQGLRDRFCTTAACAAQPGVAESLLNRLVTQSQTFPTASTASGFTFNWGAGPVPELETDMYGPLFGERGLTNGRGQLSATLTVQRLSWRELDGAGIRSDDEGLLWGDTNYNGAGRGYAGRALVDIATDMAVFAANYGVADGLDVNVAVPLVRTRVEGSNEFVDYVARDGQVVAVGAATGLVPQGRYYVRGESTGLGDVEIGAKYAFFRRGNGRLALAATARLGTGSFDEMTGTGQGQGRVRLIGSYDLGAVSTHGNVMYGFAGEELFDELGYVAGVDVRAVRNRLTLSAEFVGRRLFSVRGFRTGGTIATVRSPASGELYPIVAFAGERNDIDLFFGGLGGKLRLTGQWLLSAYVLLPAGDSGLIAQRPTFNLGLNYAF
jgi:hypothetical protein